MSAVMDVHDHLRALIAEQATGQAEALAAAWARAWNEIAAQYADEIERAVATGQIGHAVLADRLGRSLRIVSRQLLTLADQAGIILTADVRALVEASAVASGEMIAAQLPAQVGFARADPGQLSSIITRTAGQIQSRLWALAPDAEAAMKAKIVGGIAGGRNPREVARQIIDTTRTVFDGGLPRALNIARTEQLDAMRTASLLTERANRDVLKGWTWVASLSNRTCVACLAMHGTEHATDDPGPLGHPSCRCTRVPTTKSWADLGFVGITEPDPGIPDADRWLHSLPEGEQQRLLGPTRWQAWRDGDAPRDTWASRRENPSWRPSWQPTPVSTLAARR